MIQKYKKGKKMSPSKMIKEGNSNHASALLRKSLLLGVGLSTLAFAQSAMAQDANDPNEVIATGIRQSLENALIEKRQSTNLVEVILAEDIGKLPDQNLAEVLENIPGVQITRTAGVGTGVQIRGTNANRTEINGVSTVGSGSGRTGISFEDVPAAMIAGLEVTKSPDAKTIEGSVGGTVNLRTIRPLDLKDTLASIRIQGEQSSLTDGGIQPRISGVLGNKWENASGQEVGVVVSASYTEQEAVSFRPRVDRDNPIQPNAAVTAAGDPGPDFGFVNIQFLNQELENFEYETFNLSGSVEARPSDNIKLYFDAVYNDQTRRQDSSRVQGSGVSSVDRNNVPTTFETVNFGSLDGQDLGSIQAALIGTIQPNLERDDDDPNLRFSSDTGARLTTSEIYRLGTEWEKGRLSGRVEASLSTSDTNNPNLSTTLNFINPNPLTPLDGSSNDNSVPFIYDLSDGLTFGIDFASPFAPTVEQLLNPANTVLDAVTVGDNRTENEEKAIRLDFSYDLEDSALGGFVSSVDVGFRRNETSSEFNQVRSTFGTGAINRSPSGSLFSDLIVPGPDNYGDADGRDLFFQNFLLIDPNRAFSDRANVLATLQAALASTPVGLERAANGQSPLLTTPTQNPTASYNISEKTNAFYGQANFSYGIVRGNVGVRYIDTDILSLGATNDGDVSSEGSYSEWLPRANLVADVTEDIVLRAGFAKDIRRPNFNNLSLSTTFGTSPNSAVNIGNPNLAPERVTSFDIGGEWYFAPAAVLSVGLFQKKRKDLFVAQLDEPFEDADGFRDITAPCEGGGVFNPFADRNVLSPTLGNGICVPAQTFINDTGDTTQKGVEVSFQYDLSNFEDSLGGMDWVSGFGLLANYTYQEFSGGEITQSSSGRGQEIFEISAGVTDRVTAVQGLLDNSKNSYNLTAFYEKYGLSARARYTWRSSFRTLDTAAGASLNSTLGFPTVTGARGQLNASINYDITDSLNVGVEAVNLTKSKIKQYCVNEDALLCFEGLPDRRVVFGASYTF